MQAITEGIKNIIFDLGNVVVDIDIAGAFTKLAGSALNTEEAVRTVHKLNEEYEVGLLTEAEFRDALRKQLNLNATDDEIDLMWNAVLVHLPAERIELLKELAGKYRLFVLSNTNALHITRLNRMMFETAGVEDLKTLFEKVYYSHEVGLRKPSLELYRHVLQDSNLIPEETLFIDDMEVNIAGACETGIKGVCLQPPHTITTLLTHARS